MRESIVKSSFEAGVSESIGFILIFSIVIAGIGLVTLYGYPLLMKQQTSANEQIMEKNMIVLQNDVKSLAYKTVPFKETSLKIDDGALTVYNSTSSPAAFSMDIGDCSGGGGSAYVSAFHSGDLRYSSESAGTDISLQNGAVVMRSHSAPGSVMLAEPRWFYDSQTNTMVINLMSFNSTGPIARAGIGTVQMAMGDTDYYVPIDNQMHASPLCVVYHPDATPNGQDYSIAWGNYFTNSMKMTPSGAPHEYKLPVDTTKPATLVIKKYDVVIRSL